MATVNRPNAPQDYRTPPAFLDAVRKRFGLDSFDWDTACTEANSVGRLGGYYHPKYDAMRRDWNELGTCRVWCNPPWSHAGRFAERAALRTEHVGWTFLLCQAAVDSNWYADWVHNRALVLALNPRIPFLKPDGTPAFTDAKTGKPLGVNRPAMLAVYGLGRVGFEPWRWLEAKQ